MLCCCCQRQCSALVRHGTLHHAHACGGCTYTATQHKTNAKPGSKPSSERCSAWKHNYCMAHISRLSASSADRAVALHCSRPEGANTLPAMTVPTQALQHRSRRPQRTTQPQHIATQRAVGTSCTAAAALLFDPWETSHPALRQVHCNARVPVLACCARCRPLLPATPSVTPVPSPGEPPPLFSDHHRHFCMPKQVQPSH